MQTRPLELDRTGAVPAAVVRGLAVVGFALVTAAAAQVRIPLPFTPVPVTLQVFAVALSAYMLGPWAGGASQMLYLILGAAGLPVFSGGAAGLTALGGVTAGYLASYPLAAWLIGSLAPRGTRFARRLGAGLAGLLVIYVAGAAWLALLAPAGERTLGLVLGWAVTPFVALDAVKVLAAERLSRLKAPFGGGGRDRS